MTFEVGQEVVVRRNLGWGGNREDRQGYYHGGSIRSVPLGARATIGEIMGQNMIHLRFKNKNYGDGGRWYIHPSELSTPEELARANEERQKKFDSLLENVLVVDSSTVGSEKTNGRREFHPRFNPREEFAVWIREQFPDLRGCAREEQDYGVLTERRKEVMKAAKLAYKHAMETTLGCTRNGFECYFEALKKSRDGLFVGRLDGFVCLIEGVASNFRRG